MKHAFVFQMQTVSLTFTLGGRSPFPWVDQDPPRPPSNTGIYPLR